jgi:hypothetical protein
MKPKKKTTQFERQEARNNYIYIYILPSFFRRHKNHPHNLSTSWRLQTEKVPIRSRFQQVSSYHHCKWISVVVPTVPSSQQSIALHCTALVPWVALPGAAPSPAPAATPLHVTKEQVSQVHDSLHSWVSFHVCRPPTIHLQLICSNYGREGSYDQHGRIFWWGAAEEPRPLKLIIQAQLKPPRRCGSQ